MIPYVSRGCGDVDDRVNKWDVIRYEGIGVRRDDLVRSYGH
jgi:hypothetical protein